MHMAETKKLKAASTKVSGVVNGVMWVISVCLSTLS